AAAPGQRVHLVDKGGELIARRISVALAGGALRRVELREQTVLLPLLQLGDVLDERDELGDGGRRGQEPPDTGIAGSLREPESPVRTGGDAIGGGVRRRQRVLGDRPGRGDARNPRAAEFREPQGVVGTARDELGSAERRRRR